MKKLFIFLGIAIFMYSCTSSKKYIQRGQYDKAISRSVTKLRKNPTKEKEILNLKKAYDLANDRNNQRINFLKLEGKPDVWDEVFTTYSAMDRRQTLVKSVLPLNLNGQPVSFNIVDYNQEIINAKKKAAEYFYEHAKKLLERNDKQSARDAYYEFKRVKQYYNDYKDVDKLLVKALNKGTSYAYLRVENKSRFKLSQQFVDDLLNIGTANLNQDWVMYDTRKINNKNYDYIVSLKINKIDVSPEGLKENHYEETKDIVDGWEYVLDDKGNVMKDTLGNDLKKPKHVTIKCKVVEVHQHKVATIFASIDYIDIRSKQILLSKQVTADNIFDYASAAAFGDMRALKPETKKIIGRLPAPFPHDADMINEAEKVLKKTIEKALYDNRRFLK